MKFNTRLESKFKKCVLYSVLGFGLTDIKTRPGQSQFTQKAEIWSILLKNYAWIFTKMVVSNRVVKKFQTSFKVLCPGLILKSSSTKQSLAAVGDVLW